MKIAHTWGFFIIPLNLFSQALHREFADPERLNSKHYNLTSKSVESIIPFPFQKFRVIDKRQDTGKIGFELKPDFFRSFDNAFTKIKFKNNVSQTVENFYNSYYENVFTPNGKILLIVIKKLWISALPETTNPGMEKEKEESYQDLHLTFEYYYGSDTTFTPLKRIDTICKLTRAIINNQLNNNKDRMSFLIYVLKQMAVNPDYATYVKRAGTRTKRSVREIIDFDSPQDNIPALKEDLKIGVYMNIREFLLNQPSITFFEKRKLKENVYALFTADSSRIKNYWGYFDGTIIKYGSTGNSIIYRSGNVFQVFIPETVVRSFSMMLLIGRDFIIPVPKGPDLITVWCPKVIDTETGEFY